MAYANIALREQLWTRLKNSEYCVLLKKTGIPETEVIYANLFELSSGTDMLNRMKKSRLIKEYADKEDQRSKRIELTAEGERIAEEFLVKITKSATMLMYGLADQLVLFIDSKR